jgi:hypothetical protein
MEYWINGILEYWDGGDLHKYFESLTHYSNIPSFHYSSFKSNIRFILYFKTPFFLLYLLYHEKDDQTTSIEER